MTTQGNDQLGKGNLFFGQTQRVFWKHLPLSEATGWSYETVGDNSVLLTIDTPNGRVSSLVTNERASILLTQARWSRRQNNHGK